MGGTQTKHIRDRILSKRGMTQGRVKGRKRLRPVSPKVPENLKTWAMKALEEKFGQPIEVILSYGDLRQTAKRYGIDYTTVSKWRKRLGLNQDIDSGC